MIQRIQTIYLLLATIAGVALIFIPFGIDTSAGNATNAVLLVKNMLTDLIAVSAVAVVSFISIFLFKNRQAQMKLVLLAILLSLGLIALFAYGLTTHVGWPNYGFKLGAILPLFMLIFNILAYAGIKSDENLVRSMDRLR